MESLEAPLIIVTPIYEDAEASKLLFHDLTAEFGDDVCVVAVDDGSVKQPLELSSLEEAAIKGVILKLRRNVGHQKAIAIGLGFVSELIKPDQRVVIMDSDGEDLPSTVSELLVGLDSDDVQVVVAQRLSRVETVRFKVFYSIYKRFFRLLTGRPINFGNFMALKPEAIRRLVAMQELPIHIAATVLASKLPTKICPLRRGRRYVGQSKMNFVGLSLHGFKALMIFAEDVLIRVGIVCALVATLTISGAVFATILKLIGFSTPGWFSIALGILLIIFLQTGALTLISLMLTGVVRGGQVTNAIVYHDFVDDVFETTGKAKAL